MTKSFDILVHRNDENLHLRLVGDFDDKAAKELTEIMNYHYKNIARIFIHTDALERVTFSNKEKIHGYLPERSPGPVPQLLLTGRFSKMLSNL